MKQRSNKRKAAISNQARIPASVLREMERDGALPPGVMIVGSSEQSFTVYCTAAMATWCEKKARADPANATYRIVGGEIRKSLAASRILTCKYGHRHPPEKVWVNTDRPNRPRPYHCIECPERKKGQRRTNQWTAFDSPAVTGRRPCCVCFSPD